MGGAGRGAEQQGNGDPSNMALEERDIFIEILGLITVLTRKYQKLSDVTLITLIVTRRYSRLIDRSTDLQPRS